MENLTKKAVKESADYLLQASDITTTLDVKARLRGLGYWARQEEVSDYMLELADNDGCYTWSDTQTNGNSHRAYELGYGATASQAPPITNQPVTIASWAVDPTMDDAEVLDDPIKGCWQVFVYTDRTRTMYIADSVPRNVARALGEVTLAEPYKNVGANKYK